MRFWFLGYLEIVWDGQIETADFAVRFMLAAEERGFAHVLGLAAALPVNRPFRTEGGLQIGQLLNFLA